MATRFYSQWKKWDCQYVLITKWNKINLFQPQPGSEHCGWWPPVDELLCRQGPPNYHDCLLYWHAYCIYVVDRGWGDILVVDQHQGWPLLPPDNRETEKQFRTTDTHSDTKWYTVKYIGVQTTYSYIINSPFVWYVWLNYISKKYFKVWNEKHIFIRALTSLKKRMINLHNINQKKNW